MFVHWIFLISSATLISSTRIPERIVGVSVWENLGTKGDYPNILQETKLFIVDRCACQKSFCTKIYTNSICAGAPKTDASGKLVGLTSFGMPCENLKDPGVYANVAELKPWILKTIQSL
ncbi:kallikrein-6-like [Drosophila gunungcola]|uniref:kallikrein-6-like n=1 Tax=Drosophila gunungcola TaxID=103775 RepID=UPI0022E8C13A|nr:kallikrein-6-like [Drosophila gunungcola]